MTMRASGNEDGARRLAYCPPPGPRHLPLNTAPTEQVSRAFEGKSLFRFPKAFSTVKQSQDFSKYILYIACHWHFQKSN